MSSQQSEQVDIAREERERDRDISQAQLAQRADSGDVEWLREIVETHLHPGSVRILNNFLSPDFIFSNLSEAEVWELKWQIRLDFLRVRWMHPPPESGMQGLLRAACAGNRNNDLRALTPQDHAILDSYEKGILTRLNRSQEGFQQEISTKTTSVVERKNAGASNGQGGGNRLRGLVGR